MRPSTHYGSNLDCRSTEEACHSCCVRLWYNVLWHSLASHRKSTSYPETFVMRRTETIQPDNPDIVNKWPRRNDLLGGLKKDKVPTELLYRSGETIWGPQIQDFEQRHQWFKLGLCPERGIWGLLSLNLIPRSEGAPPSMPWQRQPAFY